MSEEDAKKAEEAGTEPMSALNKLSRTAMAKSKDPTDPGNVVGKDQGPVVDNDATDDSRFLPSHVKISGAKWVINPDTGATKRAGNLSLMEVGDRDMWVNENDVAIDGDGNATMPREIAAANNLG